MRYVMSPADLKRSKLMVKLSDIAYLDPITAKPLFKELGFYSIFISNHGAEVYIAYNDSTTIIISRGTEYDKLSDLKSDLDAGFSPMTFGEVHTGFKYYSLNVYYQIKTVLYKLPANRIYLTGHSLGGAMSIILAKLLIDDHLYPDAIFTFGCPRIGNSAFVRHLKIRHFRWVNCCDIVPTLPWYPFKHHGTEVYINRHGLIGTKWNRRYDQLIDTIKGLLRLKIEAFSDHKIVEYHKQLLKINI